MTSIGDPTALRAALAERVVVADGAMGTMLQASAATLSDFDGHEGCNEVLNATRPDIVRAVHDGYLEAGVDCITTNTFGANLGNLGEYGIEDRIEELSEAGATIARQAADAWATADRPRWVLGSLGPGTKLPTLGHVRFAALRDAYQLNAAGLLRGGVDAIVIETCHVGGGGTGGADRLGDHRDHRRHAARQRDRRGPGRTGTARPRRHRAELRHRPGGNERAPALPGRPLARPVVLHAQRRAADAHRRRRPLPAHPGRAGRRAREFRHRVRTGPGRRVLRHDARAHGRGRRPGTGQARCAAQATHRA